MRTERQHRQWSLSLLVSLLAAAAIALGMALYAMAQYAVNPDLSPTALLLRHGWHVLVLWLGIYACVLLGMHYLLLEPIRRIYVHLYGVGAGRVQPLHLDTRIRELNEIADGVNVMVRRMMEVGPEGEARMHVQSVARSLREVAHDRAILDPKLAGRLTDAATDLEHTLAGLRVTI